MCVLAGLGCSKLGGAIDLDSRACSGGRGATHVDVRPGRPGVSKLAGAIDLDSRACSGGRGAMNVDVCSSRPWVFQTGWGDRFG